MKKILAFLLCAVVIFVFAGCGSEVDVRGEIDSAGVSAVSEVSSGAERELSLGNTSGNNYKNEFLGIGCRLDEGWTFYTQDQIYELNNIVTDSFDEDISEQIKNATIIYDMAATDNMGGTINVNLEKLSTVASIVYDVENYIDSVLSQLEDAMAQIGFTLESCEKISVNFAGKTEKGIKGIMSVDDIKVYQKLVCIKRGNYMANITVSSVSEADVDALLAKFYAVS